MSLADAHQEQAILSSWQVNAAPWTDAVRQRQIASRERLTNAAIIETLLAIKPDALLDIGCGEGWLCRALSAHNIACTGVDAIDDLVQQARARGGRYLRLDYHDLAHVPLQPVDCAVCNFSLIGKTSTEAVFAAASHFLKTGGRLVVQTLHPVTACGEHPYEDGWREGSWQGFSERFQQAAPWYFRTLPSWQSLFAEHGFSLEQQREPTPDDSDLPQSLILVGKLTPG
ncbi:MAG: SAM-dependent methyltransferase [Spongiibacteraceae bacterium]|jgi:ubiquinone/menaquinone biosynthesis C-methylase UbiE|nr:SAM-dependent methyltransferase [Spongiibacteraceae bacterium]